MSDKLGQESAFPSFEHNESGYGDQLTLYFGGERNFIPFTKGISKRLFLAGILMQGRMARGTLLDTANAVSTAYEIVDELLKQENK